MSIREIEENILPRGKRKKKIKSISKSSKVILDIGVCKGQEIYKYFLRYSRNANIYGFEPCPVRFDRLIRKKKQKNHTNLHYYNTAVSDVDGYLDFYIDRVKRGSSSLRKPTKLHDKIVYDKKPIRVESVRLDTWYKKSGLGTIDFIWSDIEGSERELIIGGREALRNTKYFYTEYTEEEYYKGQGLLPEIIDLLSDDFEIEALYSRYNDSTGSYFKYGDILFKNKNL